MTVGLQTSNQDSVFLSTLPAGRRERRLALWVLGVSALFFALVAPFAQTPLRPVPAFIPLYQSALVINDLVTTVVLLGQFHILRWKSLLALACAYFFTALITLAHTLSFPGLFTPQGLLGAGPQTTAWLYMFWHAGFPLLVTAYLWFGRGGRQALADSPGRATRLGFAAVLAVVVALTLLATAGHGALPSIMRGNGYTPALVFVITSVWVLSVLALALLWRRRPHSVLDLWLMVVLCAWLLEVALSAMLNAGRFDLGFYAGRVYGLLASSVLLVVLLLETAQLYARLAQVHRAEQEKSAELAALNVALEAFSYSVSHDLRTPLRAVSGYAAVLQRNYGARLDEEGRRLLGRVIAGSDRMGRLIDELLAFSRLGRQALLTQEIALEPLVREVIEEQGPDYAGRSLRFKLGELGVVQADQALLKQVFANLLGNAIKYTRNREHASIDVGCDRSGATPVFHVRDDGDGFDMEHAGRLFGLFQRLHTSVQYEGTGIGLAITQHIVERHGGRIWAEARPGEGATFYFTLG